MDRIATNSAYNSVLNNLMAAEIAQNTAGNQISSTEKASDLKGYGTGAETLTALQATTTQVTGYLTNTQNVSAKLSTQDDALNEVAGGAGSALQAVTQAIASGNGTTLMSSLQDALSSAVTTLPGRALESAFFASRAGKGHLRPRRSSMSSMAPSCARMAPGSMFPPGKKHESNGLARRHKARNHLHRQHRAHASGNAGRPR